MANPFARTLRLVKTVTTLLFLGSLVPAVLQAQRVAVAISPPTLSPEQIRINEPAEIVATVLISGRSAKEGGAYLHTLDNPRFVELICQGRDSSASRMQDEGMAGDQRAGDNIYTVRLSFYEPEAGTIRCRVKVKFAIDEGVSSLRQVAVVEPRFRRLDDYASFWNPFVWFVVFALGAVQQYNHSGRRSSVSTLFGIEPRLIEQ